MPPPVPSTDAGPSRPLANFAWLVGGRLFRGAVGMLIGVWMARHLGPADYGVLNSALALALLGMAVVGLGLDSVVRQELLREPAQAPGILGTCLGLRIAAGFLAYGLLAVALLLRDPATRTTWLVAAAMLVTHVPLTVDLWFQARLKMEYTALAQNAAFAFSALLRAALILGDAPLPWFAAAIVLEGPVSALLLLRWWRKLAPTEARLVWQGGRARLWLSSCWPLLGVNLLAVGFTQVNQALLVWLANPREAGHFAAAGRIFELGSFVLTALVTTQVPQIAVARAGGPGQQEATMRAVLSRVALVAWAVGGAAILGAPWIVRGLFGSDYAGSENTLRLLGACLLPLGSGLVRYEWWVGAGRMQRLLVAYSLGGVLNLALAVWWIRDFGAAGSAAATLVALATTHLLSSLAWRDSADFARWQGGALLLRGLTLPRRR